MIWYLWYFETLSEFLINDETNTSNTNEQKQCQIKCQKAEILSAVKLKYELADFKIWTYHIFFKASVFNMLS